MVELNDPAISDPRGLYEVGFLLSPDVSLEDAPAEMTKIINILEGKGGTVVLSETPKKRDLAYTITKSEGGKRVHYDTAHFGWIKFELPSDKVKEVEGEVASLENILRHLVVHTVKQILQPRRPRTMPAAGDTGSTARPVRSDGPAKKPTDEELNKQVDDLIASTEPVVEVK